MMNLVPSKKGSRGNTEHTTARQSLCVVSQLRSAFVRDLDQYPIGVRVLSGYFRTRTHPALTLQASVSSFLSSVELGSAMT